MSGAEAKAAYILVKDVALLCRATWRTVKSAANHNQDLKTLQDRVYAEVSIIIGFSNSFMLDLHTYTAEDLEELDWFPKVALIYKDLQALYSGDLKELAEMHDKGYGSFIKDQYKVYLKDVDVFKIEGLDRISLLEDGDEHGSEDLGAPVATSALVLSTSSGNTSAEANPPKTSSTQQFKQSTKEVTDEFKQRVKETVADFRWALWNKKKLEMMHSQLEILAGKLTRLESTVMRTHPAYKPGSKSLSRTYENVAKGQPSMQSISVRKHLAIRGYSGEDQGVTAEQKAKVQSVFTTPNLMKYELSPSETATLAVGSLKTKDRSEEETILVEYKHWTETGLKKDTEDSKSQIMRLASVLASAGHPNFSTLKLRGYQMHEGKTKCALVFKFPEDSDGSKPVTLDELIRLEKAKDQQEQEAEPEEDGVAHSAGRPEKAKDQQDQEAEQGKDVVALSAGRPRFRFDVALAAAECMRSFHADGWVHEGLCSESVVFFRDSSSSLDFDHPYFVNFDYSRPVGGGTEYGSATIPADMIRRVFYQHPDRQKKPPVKFIKEHDLYSLGVLLLELGLWEPVEDIYNKNCGEGYPKFKYDGTSTPDCSAIRAVLLKAAEKLLPVSMGDDYTLGVKACLFSKVHAQKTLHLANAQKRIEYVANAVDIQNLLKK